MADIRTGRPIIGLALGSGGARGLSHIGVLKALEKANIPVDIVVGSSIGAIVGALYASTGNSHMVEQVALTQSWRTVLKYIADVPARGGLLAGKKVRELLVQQVGSVKLEKLPVRFAAVATDFTHGVPVAFTRGSVVDAVLASMTVPFVFEPFSQGKKLFLDGGLSEPVPVATARKLGADIVIAVNLDGKPLLQFKGSKTNPVAVLQHSFNIFRHQLAESNTASADIVVEPDTGIDGVVGWKGFAEAARVIQVGERAMKRQIPALQAMLEK